MVWKTLAFVQPDSHRGRRALGACSAAVDGFLRTCEVEPNTFLGVRRSQGIKTDATSLR